MKDINKIHRREFKKKKKQLYTEDEKKSNF